ncbi:MAG: FAD-dependent oxidoreductase [Rubrivivax sp.]|nr:FAD-dependent oxidoreductase [Rubrivivax sp.]
MTVSPFSFPASAPPDRAAFAVVGAGLSGLLASHLLERSGHDAVLIEARSRLGGRILGLPAADGVSHFDLGPAWVWPEINARLAHWLGALDLPLFEQHGRGASLVEGPSRELRRYAAGFAQQPPSMRVVGGTAALVDALASRLRRTQVRLGTRLQGLTAGSRGELTLALDTDGKPSTLQARSVILALPPRLLASSLTWQPVLPPDTSRRWAGTPTWMAGHAKLLAVYSRPFWREQGLSGTAVSQAGPLAEVHDASAADGQPAALFGFVGVPAPWRQRMGRQALMEAALQQLVRLFGPEAATPEQLQLQDWATEPETATPADGEPAGHPAAQSTMLPAPWQGRVHLAGTEFAPDFPGYLEGAVLAAERAVAACLVDEGRSSRGTASA